MFGDVPELSPGGSYGFVAVVANNITAAQNPDRLQSLITFPGFPSSGSDRDAMENLTDIPIRLYVGGNDTPWLEPMRETSTDMAVLGGRLSLEVFPGEDHIIASTYDGRVVFEQLESFR